MKSMLSRACEFCEKFSLFHGNIVTNSNPMVLLSVQSSVPATPSPIHRKNIVGKAEIFQNFYCVHAAKGYYQHLMKKFESINEMFFLEKPKCENFKKSTIVRICCKHFCSLQTTRILHFWRCQKYRYQEHTQVSEKGREVKLYFDALG